MYKKTLDRMRLCVQRGRCKPSFHAFIEMRKDRLSFEDAECAIRNGSIRERQWDDEFQEWKYLIYGRSIARIDIVVVAKIGAEDETIIVTVYRQLEKRNTMICSNCGKDKAYIRNVTQAFGEGELSVIIEDIPVEVCSNCGIELLANDTAKRLDKLIDDLQSGLANGMNGHACRVANFQEGLVVAAA